MAASTNEKLEFICEKVLEIAGYSSEMWLCAPEEAVYVSFQDKGLVDSLAFFVFVTRLEEEFSIRFSHEELEGDRFRTIITIAKLILSKSDN